MTKKLAGKRWFEALGRSESSRGLPLTYQRAQRSALPVFARSAIARGWILQPSAIALSGAIADKLISTANQQKITVGKLLDRMYSNHDVEQGL